LLEKSRKKIREEVIRTNLEYLPSILKIQIKGRAISALSKGMALP